MAVAVDYTYDAFGYQSGTNENVYNPFRYNGEYLDEETGYTYLRNRYYDSDKGRFISEDPIKDGLNWYSYCDGNPVMKVDFTGLSGQYEKVYHTDFGGGFDVYRDAETDQYIGIGATGSAINGQNPNREEAKNYIILSAFIHNVPVDIAIATALMESDLTPFDENGNPNIQKNPNGTYDLGLMQTNTEWIADYNKAHPNAQIDQEKLKTNWQYAVDIGMIELSEKYNRALKNKYSGDQAARATYSMYNGGYGQSARWKNSSSQYHDIDERFWRTYQKVKTYY